MIIKIQLLKVIFNHMILVKQKLNKILKKIQKNLFKKIRITKIIQRIILASIKKRKQWILDRVNTLILIRKIIKYQKKALFQLQYTILIQILTIDLLQILDKGLLQVQTKDILHYNLKELI